LAILPFRPSAQKRFQRMVQPHLQAMHGFAWRLTGNSQDAEDLVQDVVVKLYPRLDELESVDQLRPWLNRVLYRQFIDGLRKKSRQADQPVSDLMDADSQSDWLDSLEADDHSPELALGQALTAGIEQFREGNYPLAREHFERSLGLGADTPALRYNLGVVCYKTGDYAAARNHFSTLLNGDGQALAQYNLGLVALAEGRPGQARDWFGQAAADDAPDTVRQLAERQLADLSVQDNASRQQSTLARQGYLSAGLGYDSNMAGVPEDSPSNRGSAFAELVAAGSLGYQATERWRLVWDGVLYGQDYHHDSDYDTSVLQARITALQVVDVWELGIRGGGTRAWLGGDELETRAGLALLARTDACAGAALLHGCSFELAAEQVNGGPGYSAYDGQWYLFEARADRTLAGWLLEGFYRWESNNRDNFSQEGYVVSVSPRHHEIGIEAIYPLHPDVLVGAESALRHSRYDSPHQWLEQDVLVERRRKDTRLKLGLMAEYWLNRQWLVRNQWLYRNQDSGIDRYGYDRHTLTVSLEGVF